MITLTSEPNNALPASVLADGPSPDVSSRYVFVDTREVIATMQSEGFELASVSGARRRTRDPKYGIHCLDFRMPDAPQVEGASPRVLFVNAHDRSSAARFMMGVWRWACMNGLVVGATYAREVARHSGESAASLIDRIRKLAANTGPLFAQIEQWSRTELSEGRALEFAALASELRFGDTARFDPAALLSVRRAEDEGRSLWRVMNRVQENAVRGGLEGVARDGRVLMSRPLAAVGSSLSFNEALWRLTAEFAAEA